jgi:signal transduction histidine kinase
MDHTYEQKTGSGSMRMRRLSPSMLTDMHADQRDVGGMRLHGHWLFLARVLWLAIFVFALVVFCANLLLVGNYGLLTTILLVANTSVWFAVALVLFWRKSNDRAILLISLVLVLTPGYLIPRYPGALVNDRVWWLPIDILVWLTGTMLIFWYTFPDGRFVPNFTRWLALGWIAVSWLPIPIFGTTHPWNYWLSPLYALVRIAFYCSLALALMYRYQRRATLVQRQQIKWVVFASTIFIGWVIVAEIAIFVIPSYFPELGFISQLYNHVNVITRCVSVLIPLSFGIALLRYRLWDIDLIINRTLVYGVLTLSTVALYVLVVVGLGTLLQAQGNIGLALLATGLVAVLFQPLRTRLQRAVNHLMYGERDDPYRVISRLGQRLEATLATDAVLPTIVETVAQALKLPYAAITLQQGKEVLTAASYGSTRGELVRLPLVYQHEQVGELALAPRTPGERFSPADRALLEDVARQAGIAAHAVRLTADLKRLTVDLQRERERLVTSREEERRRLRRDLHDGLGPQLASLTLKLETARNRLAYDPLAQTLLSDLTGRTQNAVADIRRLVYALRPPALDELGLLAALRELTLQYSDQVAMHLDAPTCLPELSAAVEVAIYRIAQEALTNVVRHAAAQHCDIRLVLDEPSGWLSLSVQDDGCGIPQGRSVGVGLISMRERAEELGGTWTIEPMPTGGTHILVRLPYARSESTDAAFVTPNLVPEKEV